MLGFGKKHNNKKNRQSDDQRDCYQDDRYEEYDDERDDRDDRFDDTRDMEGDDRDDRDDRFDDTRDMESYDPDDRYDSSEYEDDDPDGNFTREDAEYDEENYNTFAEDDDEGDYYEDERQYYEDERDDDGEEYDHPDNRNRHNKKRHGKNNSQNRVTVFFSDFLYNMKHMSSMERIVMTTGAMVLVIAVVTLSIYANAKSVQKQVSAFQSVGENMSGVSVIGQSGLIAVSDARSARLTEMTDASTEESTEESSSESTDVTVALKITSIKADIKLKFVNKDTGKLIAGGPFKAAATGPAAIDMVDDDEDGIIYKQNVAAGTYTIKV